MEQTEEVWVFAGVRVTAERKRVFVWVNPSEPEGSDYRELWFKGSGRMQVVGAEYRVTVTRKPGGGLTRHGAPVYIGRHADDAFRAELEARHRANDAKYRLVQMEESDRRSSALDEALEPLLTVAAKLPPGDRDAFAMFVLRRVRTVF